MKLNIYVRSATKLFNALKVLLNPFPDFIFNHSIALRWNSTFVLLTEYKEIVNYWLITGETT